MTIVKIIGTGKYPNMPKGAVYHEPKEMADLLVKIGAATAESEEVKGEANQKVGAEIKTSEKKKNAGPNK